jgi:hypothetical protein
LFFEGCLQFLFFLSIFYSLLLVIEETWTFFAGHHEIIGGRWALVSNHDQHWLDPRSMYSYSEFSFNRAGFFWCFLVFVFK